MKRKSFIALFIAFASLTGFGQTFVADGVRYSVGTSRQASVSGLDEALTEVVLPSSVEYDGTTYPVTSIASMSANGGALESLTVPPSVTRIEKKAFETCRSLRTLIIEDATAELWIGNIYSYDGDSDRAEGRHQFYYCPLKELYIGRDISYARDNSDGYSPFANKNYTYAAIGPNVTRMYANFFWNCDFETFDITRATSLKDIWSDALSKTDIEELILPESVERLMRYFEFNQSLKKIYLGANLKELDYTFPHFYALEDIEVSPANPYFKSVDGALYDAAGQTLLRWPLNRETDGSTTAAKTIASGAFRDSRARVLRIPDGAENLEKDLVQNCFDLRSIIIPSSVTSIADYAFEAYGYDNSYESWWYDGDSWLHTVPDDGCVIVFNQKDYFNNTPPACQANSFKGRYNWSLWIADGGYDGPYATASGWENFTHRVSGAQPVAVVSNIAEAATVSGSGRFKPLDHVAMSVESVDNRYKFVGWYDGDQLLSTDLQADWQVVRLVKTLTARFEPVPDAAADIVTVKIIDGHVIIDIAPRADAGTYVTTLFDSEGNRLGSVTTQVDYVERTSAAQTADFSKADSYSMKIYDRDSNLLAHYAGKVADKSVSGINATHCDADNSPDVYYDLQGRKVSSPQSGLIYMQITPGGTKKFLKK